MLVDWQLHGKSCKTWTVTFWIFSILPIHILLPKITLHHEKIKWKVAMIVFMWWSSLAWNWYQEDWCIFWLLHYLKALIISKLRLRQNGRHFPDDIFKYFFLNKKIWISIKNSLNFVPKGPVNNIPALVQLMSWRQPGDKPLSEPVVVSLLSHICIIRPQRVKELIFIVRVFSSDYCLMIKMIIIWPYIPILCIFLYLMFLLNI